MLGATATGAGDFFPTPFDSLMPGVEIISTAITHLVAGDGIVRDRPVRIVDAAMAIVLPLLLVGLLVWRRNAVGLLAVTAVVLIWAAANAVAFAHGVWLDAATTIAAAVPPVILFGSLQLWSGRRRAQHLAAQNQLLEQFQTPGLQEWLTRDPDFLLAPVRQNAAVVFIDLSGFTSLSETLDPDATRGLLKEFHALVDKEATRCGGMITSFLGDGAMILFGLPARSRGRCHARGRMLDRALRQDRTLDQDLAVFNRGADRFQDRRAFRADRRLPARRPKPSAHHRDRRHRERVEPPDGSGGRARRQAGGERYVARRGGTHRRPAENRQPRRAPSRRRFAAGPARSRSGYGEARISQWTTACIPTLRSNRLATRPTAVPAAASGRALRPSAPPADRARRSRSPAGRACAWTSPTRSTRANLSFRRAHRRAMPRGRRAACPQAARHRARAC